MGQLEGIPLCIPACIYRYASSPTYLVKSTIFSFSFIRIARTPWAERVVVVRIWVTGIRMICPDEEMMMSSSDPWTTLIPTRLPVFLVIWTVSTPLPARF